MPRLSARAVKCTIVLDAEEIAAFPEPATPRVVLVVVAQDVGTISVEVATKSLRKAQSALAEHGAGNVVIILQGKLAGGGGRLAEADLVAQVKAPKPVVEVGETAVAA